MRFCWLRGVWCRCLGRDLMGSTLSGWRGEERGDRLGLRDGIGGAYPGCMCEGMHGLASEACGVCGLANGG